MFLHRNAIKDTTNHLRLHYKRIFTPLRRYASFMLNYPQLLHIIAGNIPALCQEKLAHFLKKFALSKEHLPFVVDGDNRLTL